MIFFLIDRLQRFAGTIRSEAADRAIKRAASSARRHAASRGSKQPARGNGSFSSRRGCGDWGRIEIRALLIAYLLSGWMTRSWKNPSAAPSPASGRRLRRCGRKRPRRRSEPKSARRLPREEAMWSRTTSTSYSSDDSSSGSVASPLSATLRFDPSPLPMMAAASRAARVQLQALGVAAAARRCCWCAASVLNWVGDEEARLFIGDRGG